jgi:hypothetical protein
MGPHHLRRAVALLLITAGTFLLPAAHGQGKELPIDPDSVYEYTNPRAAEIFDGDPVPTNVSAEAWRADLDTLAARIRRRVPYAESATGRRSFDRRLDSLKRAIGGQTRDQRILSVFRLVNLHAAGTGHTTVRASQPALKWQAIPLWPYRFADGVYVMAAANPSLISRELLSIGGTPIDSVYAALASYASADNRWHRQYMIEGHNGRLLWFANPLRALGIVDQIDKVSARIRTEDGRREHVWLKTMPLDSREWVRFFTSPKTRLDVPTELQWSPASTQQDNGEPNYRLSYRDSSDILYVDFNAVVNASPDWTTTDLADSLRRIADTRPLDKFVLDLRTNNGGSSSLAQPLVELLGTHPKIDRRGALYVLISERTFSAAGIFAMQLERKTKAIFAGQPSGFAPNIWGENTVVRLPNSGIVALTSYAYHQTSLPGDPRTHLEPDLRVPFTSAQHYQNVDSTMIAVRRHDPEPRGTTTLTASEKDRFAGTYRLSPVHIARVREENGELHLRIVGVEGPGTFLSSDLYPLSETRLATDVSGAFLKRTRGKESLRLTWKDTTYALSPVPAGTRAPIEHVRDGNLELGADQLQQALASGMRLSNDLIGFSGQIEALLDKGKNQDALRYAQAARELLPASPEVHLRMAQVYQALGRDEDARRAARKVVQFSPVRGKQWVRRFLEVSIPEIGR